MILVGFCIIFKIQQVPYNTQIMTHNGLAFFHPFLCVEMLKIYNFILYLCLRRFFLFHITFWDLSNGMCIIAKLGSLLFINTQTTLYRHYQIDLENLQNQKNNHFKRTCERKVIIFLSLQYKRTNENLWVSVECRIDFKIWFCLLQIKKFRTLCWMSV